MTIENSHESDSDFEPRPSGADRFIDAMLTQRFCDSPVAMERRLARAMNAVRGEHARRSAWQWWALPLAAVLALSFLFVPTTSSASALVRSATKVARLASDRRYEVVMVPVARRVEDSPPPIEATLDVRDSEHMRLQLRFPDGHTIQHGRNGLASWHTDRDGVVTTNDESRPWPRWIETPDGSLLVDSMASMLNDLAQGYTLTRVENSSCGGQSGLVQIDAARTAADAPTAQLDTPDLLPQGPPRPRPADHIVMCIDPATNEVIRLEMHFSHQPPPPIHGDRPDHPEHAPPPPPHGGRGQPGPPQSLIFTRAPLTAFAEGWFSPPASN